MTLYCSILFQNLLQGNCVLVDNEVWLAPVSIGSGPWRHIGPLDAFTQAVFKSLFHQVPFNGDYSIFNPIQQVKLIFEDLIPYLGFNNRHHKPACFLSPKSENIVDKLDQDIKNIVFPCRVHLNGSFSSSHLHRYFKTPSAILSAELVPMQALSQDQTGADIALNGVGFSLQRASARSTMNIYQHFVQSIKEKWVNDIVSKYPDSLTTLKSDFDDIIEQNTIRCYSDIRILYEDPQFQVQYSQGCFALIRGPKSKGGNDANFLYQGIPIYGTTRHDLLSVLPCVAQESKDDWSEKRIDAKIRNLRLDLLQAKYNHAQALVKWVSQ